MLISQCKNRLSRILLTDSDTFYKVLILDEATRAVLAPHFRLSDLRSHGVAALFMLHSRRDELTAVPAIYFVQPTAENIQRISADITTNLYPYSFLSFASKTPRILLENLAASAGSNGRGNSVKLVRDEFLDFVALGDNIFTLNKKKSYLLYDSKVSPTNIIEKSNDYLSKAASSLSGVFCTLQEAPFIVGFGDTSVSLIKSLEIILKSALSGCSKDHVLKKKQVDLPFQKNMDQGQERKHESKSPFCSDIPNSINSDTQNKYNQKNFSSSRNSKRPLLIIVDRSADPFCPISHTWAYNGLLCDLLNLNLNRITVIDKETKKEKNFDLETSDAFWEKNEAADFQTVSAEIENEILVLKKELAARCISDSAEHSQIAEALKNAPRLATRNDQLRGHMSACLELIDEIKKRNIDDFYRLETARSVQDHELAEITEKGTQSDILRLGIKLLGKANPETIKRMYLARNIHPEILDLEIFSQKSTEIRKIGQGLLKTVIRLLPRSTEPAIYYIVDNIFSCIKNSRKLEEFKTSDPVHGRPTIYDCEISRIIVFVVGNGCYEEYNSMMRLSKKIGCSIIYGCDDLVSPEEHISQIAEKHKIRLYK